MIALGCAPAIQPNPTRAATAVSTPRPTVPHLPTFTIVPKGGPVFPEPIYVKPKSVVVLAGHTGAYLPFSSSKAIYNLSFYDCVITDTLPLGGIAYDAWIVTSLTEIEQYQINPCQ